MALPQARAVPLLQDLHAWLTSRVAQLHTEEFCARPGDPLYDHEPYRANRFAAQLLDGVARQSG